jgi:PKD repeat protein
VISGATVLILDGANAGRSTTTNNFGRYTFTGLTPANANLSARAGGYFERRSGLYIDGTATLDFALMAEPPPSDDDDDEDENGDPRVTIAAETVTKGDGYHEIRFTAESNVELDFYEWEFGPSSAKSNKRVEQHNYVSDGKYTVRVTARTKNGGKVVTATLDIEIEV